MLPSCFYYIKNKILTNFSLPNRMNIRTPSYNTLRTHISNIPVKTKQIAINLIKDLFKIILI